MKSDDEFDFPMHSPSSIPMRLAVQALSFVTSCLLSPLLPAQDNSTGNLSNRRILHEISVVESAGDGTIVQSLQNQFPDFSHFQLVPERRELPFQVSDNGEISIADPNLLNFEKRSLWTLTIRAKRVRTNDPFLDDFLASVETASGTTDFDTIKALRHEDVVLTVRVHVVDQDETPILDQIKVLISPHARFDQLARITPIENDRSDDLTFSVTCSTCDQLQVDPRTGIVSLSNSDRFEWSQNQHALEIEVRDQQGNVARTIVEFEVIKPELVVVSSESESTLIPDPSLTLSHSAASEVEIIPVPNDEVPVSRSETEPEVALGKTDIISSEPEQTDVVPHETIDGPTLHKPDYIEPHVDHANETATVTPEESVVVQDNASSSPPMQHVDAQIEPVLPEANGVDQPQTLEDAARTIAAGTGASISLIDDQGAPESLSILAPIQRDGTETHVTSSVSTKQPPATLSRERLPRLVLVFVSLMTIGVMVFLHYRKARIARTEILKQSAAESEMRLGQYLNANETAESNNASSSNNESKMNSVPQKAIDNFKEATDPDSLFDPESLAGELSSGNENEDLLTGTSSESFPKPSLPEQCDNTNSENTFPLLSPSLLVAELLAPQSKPTDDLAALQAQLKETNSRFDAIYAAAVPTSDVTRSTTLPNTATAATEGPLSEPSKIESSLPEQDPEPNSSEPAYEFLWDSEIQRYIKVEKRPVPGYGDDSASEIDDRTGGSNLRREYSLQSEISADSSARYSEFTPSTIADSPTTDRVKNLRAELADLFEMSELRSNPPVAIQSAVEELEESANSAQEDDAPCEEKTHLDSVARYLSQLLERSRKEESEDVFVDRRRNEKVTAPGPDRRQTSKPAVKSYIEEYLEQQEGASRVESVHGENNNGNGALVEVSNRPTRQHKPVDLTQLRENMESFRAVAERSVEKAMVTYKVRLAKGRLVGRSVLIGGLTTVVVLGIKTNVVRNFHLEPLNWLVCSFILLCIAEFFLRLDHIRKHNRELHVMNHNGSNTPSEPNDSTDSHDV